ncbi:MAG: hypothetical protein LBK94_01825 [Prevotellaceae bacterium]|jgi:hypothetical protein|nr:hypothetical protein [Prevotellaceae bacterium]
MIYSIFKERLFKNKFHVKTRRIAGSRQKEIHPHNIEFHARSIKFFVQSEDVLAFSDKFLAPSEDVLAFTDKFLVPSEDILAFTDKFLAPSENILAFTDKRLAKSDKMAAQYEYPLAGRSVPLRRYI